MYLVGSPSAVQRLRDLIGSREFETVLKSGGKLLVTYRSDIHDRAPHDIHPAQLLNQTLSTLATRNPAYSSNGRN